MRAQRRGWAFRGRAPLEENRRGWLERLEVEAPVLEEELEGLSEQRAREVLDTAVEKVQPAGGTVAQAHLRGGGVPHEIVTLAEDTGEG